MPTDHRLLSYDATALGDTLLRHEWLVTNGTGTYAAGTAMGVNTRRYHGLLIAAARPPVGRVAVLNQCLDQLVLRARDATGSPVEQIIELSSMLFRTGDGGTTTVPDGHRHLTRFTRGLSATWTLRWGGITVRRELLLHWKQPAVTLRYTVTGLTTLPAAAREQVTLRLGPMLTLRDFHGLLRREHAGPMHIQPLDSRTGVGVTVRHGDHAATCTTSGGRFNPAPDWWYGHHYPIDQRRGQDDHEDHFLPGRFEIPLTDPAGPCTATLTVTLGDQPVAPNPDTTARADHLRPAETRLGPACGPLAPVLAEAADDFVVDRTVGRRTLATILAGYPWFADWGRDTFIALDGLLLCTGRLDDARATLCTFAGAIGHGEHEGLIPNRFDDHDQTAADHNTVDGSLWFVHAALRYLQASGDTASWTHWLAPACLRIIRAYQRGTGYGIRMDHDGLITAGSHHTQLTWMDAAAVPPGGGDLHVFTPRPGKCVEINALWYSDLTGLAEHLPPALARDAADCAALARRVKTAFARTFWNEPAGCLFDHVDTDPDGRIHPDPAIRPNQCFAVSLPRSPLGRQRARRIMALVTERLLTPVGLHTLDPADPAYCPWYSGPPYQRDAAYHQGTIWPWLIGPYAEGLLRSCSFSPSARRQARAAIDPLLEFLTHRGVGQLHEIHQAQPVHGHHPPRGCFAQAWSIAEVIRILCLLTGADNTP